MSVPTLTGLTLISAADSTTNWSGWGQNSAKWALESDIIKEGTGSLGLAPFQTGDGGYGYTAVGGVSLSSNLLMVWVYTTPGFLDIWGQYGCYIRVGSDASWTTNYSDFRIGGSDVAWVGRGWHLIVLDCNRTPDRSSGTANLSSIQRVGVGFNMTATASKSTIVAIDAMYYGNTLEVTGPSVTGTTLSLNENGASADTITRGAGSFVTDGWEAGDFVKVTGSATAANDGVYEIQTVAATTLTLSVGDLTASDSSNASLKVLCSVTLEDIYQKDGPTDDLWKGVVDKDPSGAYVINYPLTIGDVAGSLDCFFLSRGETIVLADQPLDTTREDYLITAEDTGETHVLVGDSTGTGDSRVGFAGSVIAGQEAFFSAITPRGINFGAEITALEVYGALILAADGGVDFAATGTGHYLTNTTFDGCGQVDLGGVEARNLTFSGYSGGGDAALLWNGSIDLKNSRFLANSQAIEHPTTTGSPFSYVGLQFAGNGFDINNTAGGAITVNATAGSNPGTSTGSSVTINNPITHTVSNLRSGDRVIWIRVSDGAELENLVESSGSAVYSYNYTADVAVDVQVLSGDYARKNTVTRVTLGSTNSGFPAVQANDPVYDNPT